MDIGRKVEIWLCRILRTYVTTLPIVPGQGEAESDGELLRMVPPFVLVEVVELEDRMPNESTWMLQVGISYTTHLEDATSTAHDAQWDAILAAAFTSNRGVIPDLDLVVHGVDVAGRERITDTTDSTRGDVLLLSVGASG